MPRSAAAKVGDGAGPAASQHQHRRRGGDPYNRCRSLGRGTCRSIERSDRRGADRLRRCRERSRSPCRGSGDVGEIAGTGPPDRGIGRAHRRGSGQTPFSGCNGRVWSPHMAWSFEGILLFSRHSALSPCSTHQEPSLWPPTAWSTCPAPCRVDLSLDSFSVRCSRVGVALVVDRFDTRLRDRKSVEETTGVPVLIELPLADDGRARRSAAGLVFGPQYNGPLAERFRRLRSALLLVGDRESSGPTRTDVVSDRKLGVLVCSPGPSAVRSMAAANLAAAFAESGRSVILVTQRVSGSCADLLVGQSHATPPTSSARTSTV